MTAYEKFEKDITAKLALMTPEELQQKFEALGVVFGPKKTQEEIIVSNLNHSYQYGCYSQYKGKECSGNVIHWLRTLHSLNLAQDSTIHMNHVTYFGEHVADYTWIKISEIGFVPVFTNVSKKISIVGRSTTLAKTIQLLII